MLEARPAVSFRRSQVQDPAGLVTTGPQPLLLAARRVWLGTRKTQLACQLQSILLPHQSSLDLHCPQLLPHPQGRTACQGACVMVWRAVLTPSHFQVFMCESESLIDIRFPTSLLCSFDQVA